MELAPVRSNRSQRLERPLRRKHSGLRTGISTDTVRLALASFFADISSEMLYPVLPVFLTQTLHATGRVLGVIEGLASAFQNIVQGFSGLLSDRLHERKRLALGGYLVSALGKPLMGAATSWFGVLGGRLTDRLGAGFRSAPRDALVAGSADDAHRGRAFGLEGIGDNLGACAGPLVAWLLIVAFAFPMRTIFFLAVVPGLLAFLMVLRVRERPVSTVAPDTPDTPPLALRDLPSGYWKYLVVTAVFGIGARSSNAFIVMQTQSIGTLFGTTILIYAGFNFVAALVSYPAGAVSDLKRPRYVSPIATSRCVCCDGRRRMSDG